MGEDQPTEDTAEWTWYLRVREEMRIRRIVHLLKQVGPEAARKAYQRAFQAD